MPTEGNQLALLKNKGRLYVWDEASGVKRMKEVSLTDNFEFNVPTNPIEIKSPSGITIFKTLDPEATATCDFYHPGDNSILELLFRGVFSNTTYDGNTAVTETVAFAFRQAGEAMILPGYDGDKTAVTVSAVVLDSNTSTSYDVTDDYTVNADSTTGMSYITHVSNGAIPVGQEIRVTYSYTPLASNVLRPIENGTQVLRNIVIDSVVSSTKYRRYVLPRCTVTSDLSHKMLEFGKENSNPNFMSLKFEYSKPDTGSLAPAWYWIDTINV